MSVSSTITLSFPDPDIALLSFDTPGKGANLLSSSVLDELSKILTELEARPELAGIIFKSGKPGSFIAGADIREFVAEEINHDRTLAMCRRGQTLLKRLATGASVSVAAIDGNCFGGGAELALWCDQRLMTSGPKTEFGLPEVKLGLIPGWGGTARAPRILGLSNAVELICGGEPLDSATALAWGLVSDIVSTDALLAASIRLIREEKQSGSYLKERERRAKPVDLPPVEVDFLRSTALAKIQEKTKGHYAAPIVALNLLESAALDLDAACEREANAMTKVFGSPENLALVNVFFLNDRVKRDTGLSRKDVQARPVQSLGLIGAGLMGVGIAAAAIRRETPVVLQDAAAEVLAKSIPLVMVDVAYNKKTQGPDPEQALRLTPLLRTTSELGDLTHCDLIIEAVTENADVKRQVFAKLEPFLHPHTILASNTSTIPITKLAGNLANPDRFCGIHFFNPVRKMQMVEIIRGECTSDETVAAAVAFVKRIGKSPVVVKDGPGFLVNRLLRSYLNEALQLLTEGTKMADIERASFAFGMPIGPFTLYDLVGIDTAFYAGRTMFDAFPDRVVASPILPALIKSGRLGVKNGLGFFSYQNSKGVPTPDPRVDELLSFYLRNDREAGQEEITNRLFFPMLLEATRILEEGRVRDVRDIDFGVIFGLGFPAFRGGLMFWGDTLGAAKIVEELKRIDFLGARAKPTQLLLDMARSGKRFYQ